MNKFIGAGVDSLLFKNDARYRRSLLNFFSCLYPQNAFKFDCTIDRDLEFNFARRDAFMTELPMGFPIRINCLFWDFSMKRLRAIPVNKRWEFLREWTLALLEPVQNMTVIGIDVINEPLRLKGGEAALERSLPRLLGEDWMDQAIEMVRGVCDFSLFCCQHQIGYEPIQDAFKDLIEKLQINPAVQCTASSFATNKFGNLDCFLGSLPGTIHVPEITVWRYRVGRKSVPLSLRKHEFWKSRQVLGYIKLLQTLSKCKNVDLIGFWEPCLHRTFYHQDDKPGFLDCQFGIMEEKIRDLLIIE